MYQTLIYNREDDMQSYVYTLEADIEPIEGFYNGKPFFRKIFQPGYAEAAVARLVQSFPHPNVVSIYNITEEYYDMEYLPIGDANIDDASMTCAKDHLQSIGVMYIDWKCDNVRMTSDGVCKLIDFDCSGILSSDGSWLSPPPMYYNYKRARLAGMTTPKEIDEHAFSEFIRNL